MIVSGCLRISVLRFFQRYKMWNSMLIFNLNISLFFYNKGHEESGPFFAIRQSIFCPRVYSTPVPERCDNLFRCRPGHDGNNGIPAAGFWSHIIRSGCSLKNCIRKARIVAWQSSLHSRKRPAIVLQRWIRVKFPASLFYKIQSPICFQTPAGSTSRDVCSSSNISGMNRIPRVEIFRIKSWLYQNNSNGSLIKSIQVEKNSIRKCISVPGVSEIRICNFREK